MKRNEKGEEYYHTGEIYFEGTYLNGKRWKGKRYDENGKIMYELKDGKGIIRENNKYESFLFVCDYSSGDTKGKGKIYLNGKIIFEGEYLNSQRNGNRKLYNEEGINCSKWKGKGYDEKGNTEYELKNGTGKVKEYHENGEVEFEGEYLNGKKNGKGKEYNYYRNLENEV